MIKWHEFGYFLFVLFSFLFIGSFVSGLLHGSTILIDHFDWPINSIVDRSFYIICLK